MGQAPTLTVLVPRRPSVYWLILLSGIAINLLLGGLYRLGLELAPLTTDHQLAAFDLDAEGSLGGWVSSMVLFLSGLMTLLVRRLRRVLAPALAGEQRGWLLVSAVWFTMSVDEAASLHEGFKEMMARALGTRLVGDGSIYWVIPYFVGLSVCGLFLFSFLRHVAASVRYLLLAGVSYAVAVAGQLELLLRGMGPIEVWVEESCELFGDLFILLALSLYARRIAGQIEGIGKLVECGRIDRLEAAKSGPAAGRSIRGAVASQCGG